MTNRLILQITLSAIYLLCSLTVAGQDQSRVIRWPPRSQFNSKTLTRDKMVDRIDEVEIESITVDGQPVIIGQSFIAREDWLKNIRFRIRNISSRPIGRFQISLTLPEVFHGQQIGYICVECSRKEQPIVIEPRQEVEIVMPAGGQYEWVMRQLAERKVSTVREAQILVAYVTLTNGTLMASDCVKTSDPRNACTQIRP